MKAVITLLFFSCFLHARCQTPEEAWDLYAHKKYDEALELSYKLIKNENNPASANELIGRILVDQGKYDAAIPYLQQSLKLDDDKTYISGWSYVYLGRAYIMKGEKEKGVTELKKAIDLKSTANSVKQAQYILDNIDYIIQMQNMNTGKHNALEPDWVIIEGKHIIYYFQDTTNRSFMIPLYIKQHEEAYLKINETFQATLPKKMVFYVWNDRALAKQILHRDLGFTDPEDCIINTAIDQTVGHEMTHALSYWGWGYRPTNKTGFINEGVAVAFDQTQRDKNETARNAIAGKNIHSVLDIWQNERAGADLIYPVGGAFVSYLYKKCTPEQFKDIIKDQTVENTRTMLGIVAFNAMIAEFNTMMGFQ